MLKNLVGVLVLSCSVSVFASDLVQSALDLEQISGKITRLAQRITSGNENQRTERNLKIEIQSLIDSAEKMKSLVGQQRDDDRDRPGRGGGRGDGPQRGRDLYTAKCHIDDDPDLTYDQYVLDVKGQTIADLIDNCNELGRATHNRKQFSTGLKNLKFEGSVSNQSQSGVCHIDDDPDMTFDQIVIGTIYGESLQDIIDDCKLIAKNAYKNSASSGLKSINKDVVVPRFMSQAICHIDDDPDMTYDQFVVGTVFGNSIREISNDCAMIARDIFGSRGSSGLRNIKQ